MGKSTGFVVELGVKSVERAMQFYCEKLGCTVVESVPGGSNHLTWAELELQGTRLMLQQSDLLCAELPRLTSHSVAKQFALVVRIGPISSAKALYSKLVASGYGLDTGPVETDYGTYEFSFSDPDGFVLLIAGRD